MRTLRKFEEKTINTKKVKGGGFQPMTFTAGRHEYVS